MSHSNLSEFVLTRQSIAHILAYCHYYTPKLLSSRGRLAPRHLRHLANRIGLACPDMRSLRQHLPLAAHFVLLKELSFITIHGSHLLTTPIALLWLQKEEHEQWKILWKALLDIEKWQDSCESLNLAESLPIEYPQFLRQTILRQENKPKRDVNKAVWQVTCLEDCWQLCLPEDLEPRYLFDLLQWGQWEGDNLWQADAWTIGKASQHGYGEWEIVRLLEIVTGKPLSGKRMRQLQAWLNQATAFTVRTIQLLEARQPEQLAQIRKKRKFRPFIWQQLSPRHLSISGDLTPYLKRWLTRQKIPLNQIDAVSSPLPFSDYGYHWLGLRLLIGLGQLIPLPCKPPHIALELVATNLTSSQLTDLDEVAKKILAELEKAIRGTDAFLPGLRLLDEEIMDRLVMAIKQEKGIDIWYQGLVDPAPIKRHVQPLWLEEQGALVYLHAFCYLVEAERVFRLDRIDKLN